MRSLFKPVDGMGIAVDMWCFRGASRFEKARRLVVASLCGLTCVLMAGAFSPAASGALFGGEGGGSGRIDGASGVALDNATGDVYVADERNHRVDKFDGSGGFLMAWGWAVEEESPARELQACTSACQPGGYGEPFGPGEASGESFQSVAVDNDPLSSSYQDVYVVDWDNFRVQKFDSSGKFLLMFGGGVNKTSGGDVCAAGEECGRGEEGEANGQFLWFYHPNGIIAVGPQGRVYVGDKARIEVFEPSGAWTEDISLSGVSPTGKVTALAVDSAGDVFVKDSEAAGVREFTPFGVETATEFDAGSTSVGAIALDASSHLFVADFGGGFHVLEYDSTGNELENFGLNAAKEATGMAFSDALGELYMSTGGEDTVRTLAPPPPGPVVESASESVTPGRRGAATLEAAVDPEGSETAYRFEYVDEAHYQSSGYASASSTASASIASGLFEDHQAVAGLTNLVAGGTYHYRIVASNANGTVTGPDQTFEPTPAALVEGPWATNVAGTSATLSARIDPLGVRTQYRLEYGTGTSYDHVLSGDVGEEAGYVFVSQHEQGLQSGTTYHYRVVATNEVGTVEGADHSFTTQVESGELVLPDGRAWELVSPANKQGAAIEPFEGEGQVQAAREGSAISYLTSQPVGENPTGKSGRSQILSVRWPDGWRSEDISIPYALPKTQSAVELFDYNSEYRLFSSDLSRAVIEPHLLEQFSLSPEAPERTDYLRNNKNGAYIPLVSGANVPPGTKYGGKNVNFVEMMIKLVAATPDLSHVVLHSPQGLTPDATPPECENPGCHYAPHLFEWSAGQLQLVSILPDGKQIEGEGAEVELAPSEEEANHAISSDGRWIAWTTGHRLYIRDMVRGSTIKLGGASGADFQTMSGDGSRIFFLESGELYAFNTDTGVQVDLTSAHGANEVSAGVKDAVLGASEDGSYIYFVATGVLANGAVAGSNNLYVSHQVGGTWSTSYVGALSSEDEKDWFGPYQDGKDEPLFNTARVSPSGRFLAFMSNRSLTGYDNTDAVSGQPDEEVYLYDAVADRLACVSCNPTGIRPIGIFDSDEQGRDHPLVDRIGSWASKYGHSDHWLAGSLPGWRQAASTTLYQPRYLSNSGRLFFDSSDALVPGDTNGLEDVYQYEPIGVGGCTTSEVTFNQQRSGGCVNLVSAGTSSLESAFIEASENGDDVFFVTASKLAPADYDTSYDVYDAHVCSAQAPCMSTPVAPPPCTSGDSCKAAPSAQPEIFGPAPSATFSGTGNLSALPTKHVIVPRALARAEKLARALAACRRKRNTKMRAICERQARKRYRAKRARAVVRASSKGWG
jgi:hypothetical protein